MVARGLLIVLLLLANGATALELDVTPPGMMRPELEPQTVAGTVTMPCTEALEHLSPGQQAVQVHLNVSADRDGFVFSGPSTMVLDASSCLTNPTGETSVAFEYDGAATRDAPGLVTVTATLTATAQNGNPLAGEDASATRLFPVVADYLGASRLQVDLPIVDAIPGERVAFDIALSNEGNAATTYTFSTDGTESPRMTIHLPDAVSIPAGATETVTVHVDAPSQPGWNNEVGTLLVQVSTHATDDASREGNTITASLLLRTRGAAGTGPDPVAVPGPGIALAPLLLAAAALRRRA